MGTEFGKLFQKGRKMKFIKLTHGENNDIEFSYVRKSEIVTISKIKHFPDERVGYDTNGANSVIYLKNDINFELSVKEKAEDIIREIDKN